MNDPLQRDLLKFLFLCSASSFRAYRGFIIFEVAHKDTHALGGMGKRIITDIHAFFVHFTCAVVVRKGNERVFKWFIEPFCRES